jgi:4-hydroxy-tetrahydrodipicolinate reductase
MKIVLIGYGKMGKAIEIVAKKRGHDIVLIIDENNLHLLESTQMQNADVAIEFSVPKSAPTNIKHCINIHLPIIVGTTGWDKEYVEIKKYCIDNAGTMLAASNFSIGVNIFFALNAYLANIMKRYNDYNCSISEIHHMQKLDAPSGTAITLANEIIKQSDHYESWRLKEKMLPEEICIQSIREGEVPGTHIVQYNNDIDTIQIKHEAHNREGFALGAVLAAEWIMDKKGVYEMKDVLGI